MIPTAKADCLNIVYTLVAVRLFLAPFQVYLFSNLPLKWRGLMSDVRGVVWVGAECYCYTIVRVPATMYVATVGRPLLIYNE